MKKKRPGSNLDIDPSQCSRLVSNFVELRCTEYGVLRARIENTVPPLFWGWPGSCIAVLALGVSVYYMSSLLS